MITEHYKANAKRANKWLAEHAPDYVYECVEELGHNYIMAKKDINILAIENANLVKAFDGINNLPWYKRLKVAWLIVRRGL